MRPCSCIKLLTSILQASDNKSGEMQILNNRTEHMFRVPFSPTSISWMGIPAFPSGNGLSCCFVWELFFETFFSFLDFSLKAGCKKFRILGYTILDALQNEPVAPSLVEWLSKGDVTLLGGDSPVEEWAAKKNFWSWSPFQMRIVPWLKCQKIQIQQLHLQMHAVCIKITCRHTNNESIAIPEKIACRQG